MRIGIEPLPRARDLHPVEQAQGLRTRRLAAQTAMQGQRLAQLLADPMHRIQRRSGILEDHRDALAANARQRIAAQRIDRIAIEPHLTRHARPRAEQAQHGKPGHALAAARFADDAQRLAMPNVEIDAVQHRQPRDAVIEGHLQSVNRDQRRRLGRRGPAPIPFLRPRRRRGEVQHGAHGKAIRRLLAVKSIVKVGDHFQAMSLRLP